MRLEIYYIVTAIWLKEVVRDLVRMGRKTARLMVILLVPSVDRMCWLNRFRPSDWHTLVLIRLAFSQLCNLVYSRFS